MKLRFSVLLWISTISCQFVFGQLLHDKKDLVFTRADSLRGMLTPLRTCYDLTYYHLDVKVDTLTKSIVGSNKIKFTIAEDFDRMQIDLFQNMKIERIVFEDGVLLPYEREYNAVFITYPGILRKNTLHEVTVYYSGQPIVAKRPPWQGGFTWTKDKTGNPWIGVTCQGTGASLWWPNKDHQADEPDSMMISVTVPRGLMDVSNGRLRNKTELSDGWTRYDWFVSYPINNYNVTLNIGKYAYFSDLYTKDDTLTLDYYVMPYNLDRAKEQFEQVKSVIECFEKFFGEYPFKNDGYKLVESSYLGMEHQSAVAYGNNYLQGYNGTASSEVGLLFDFIIVHETAHEWWGNSVTSTDIADMWIHESFGAYAEAVYVECMYGYEDALTYINGKKSNVSNTRPIRGVYGVNQEGSRDMYNKGQLVLNTLRHVINNDPLWWDIIRSIATEFRYQTINADDIVSYINTKTGSDYTYFFDQYLKFPQIPQLEIVITKKGETIWAKYKWNSDVDDFRMPIKITITGQEFDFVYPTSSWQSIQLHDIAPEEFKIAEDLFYVDSKVKLVYVDPRKGDD